MTASKKASKTSSKMLVAPIAMGVIIISAGLSSKSTTLALVQDSGTNRQRAQTVVEYDRERRIRIFGKSIFSSPYCRASMLLANTNQAEESDPDLFDYFDPLLSPHAYPSGISPERKSVFKNIDEIQQQRRNDSPQYENNESKGEFGFRLSNTEQSEEQKRQPSTKGELGFKVRMEPMDDSPKLEEKEEKVEEDLFDYFDPLRSPHEYPDGIKSNKESISSATAPPALEVVEDKKSSSAINDAKHSKSDGKKKKVGVLLMDHGSKKEKSNARLQAMAKLYEMTLTTDDDEDEHSDATATVIVRAAHMEIATPSIPDGLKELKDLGVDEIICHPYFLNAYGRHMKEDIPGIIGNAVEDLWGENSGATSIPVVTTAPVGSNTQLMLGAIHSL
eukprot:CAMPEP_0197195044 /NCGR_PEP_ID=MMETSP1423-20130617/30346_1 /TAXON_ID=476441 /ORGANISM="Pseudo-nitzschia heimii, Strain UNC1101" /LENGTH=389 /DNA_ID=CAMNT_0042648581 /DNA_START=46 /DNA_END=1212 /DNA_ORIENTATION=+